MDALLTTEDVAEFFRMDVVTIRRMIAKGELPAYRVGGEYRFKRADIDEYLEQHRVPASNRAHGHRGTLARQARKLVTRASVKGAFDHFTQRAKDVLALAQEEAQYLNHGYIGTEHLLLGTLREEEGVGGTVLREAGCTLEATRQAVRDSVGLGPEGVATPGELPVTPRVKKVLELAVDEAKRLEHAYVGTEHLVLALLREGEGVAGRQLADLGMELGATRRRVVEIVTRQGAS